MVPTKYNYPFFEANQVLTNRHLNQLFSYLDEQERLTRANLIGIGIVCGLDISLEGTAAAPVIRITRGCGVTSQGYLIVEPEDVLLTSYQPTLYQTPDDLPYESFKDPGTNTDYPMWELFPAGEPNTTPLGNTAGFLDDKAVLLFLELKREGLRNCSPNNCDDKGAEVTITLRRLLIRVDDLAKVIATANQQSTSLTPADIEASLLARLNLPDLRMPRYDVPNSEPATSQQVLGGFLAVFPGEELVKNTGDALSAAYQAFQPILEEAFPTDPFAGFKNAFGFLENTPANQTQVRFLQYYYDFFDDLLRAYDEFRWAGFDLMCACCPPEGLFPRHLMLGVLYPDTVTNPSIYRHTFLASAAISGCEERSEALLLLFRRLVEMIGAFTNTPTLRPGQSNTKLDPQIRVTPSKLGDMALSEKAIPYYYKQTGTPPLYRVWSAEKARRNRANQNFSYRSNEYSPAAPGFIEEALRFDLEPSNFLRIEGHLGKNYQQALKTLLYLKAQYRLPIEIIALRTGAFDENAPIDLSKENCRFQDLDAQYSAIREELRCFLYKQLAYLYDPPVNQTDTGTAPAPSKYAFFYDFDKKFQVRFGSTGYYYERLLTLVDGKTPYASPSGAVNAIDNINPVSAILYILPFLHRMHEILPEALQNFSLDEFELRYGDLQQVAAALEAKADATIQATSIKNALFNWEEVDDRIEAILFHCRPDALKALIKEYIKRIKEAKQKQFFSYFARKHPGLQHKGGVPVGGTFILVYHDDPDPVPPTFNPNLNWPFQVFTPNLAAGVNLANNQNFFQALYRINANPSLATDPDVRTVLGSFIGQVYNPNLSYFPPWQNPPTDEVEKILDETVDELTDGTIIADFFLPYICCSDCSPVQYVLPSSPLGVSIESGCTDKNRQAEIVVKPQGGVAPFSYNLNSSDFKPLTGNLVLTPGTHTLVVRDDTGAETTVQTIEVPEPITFGAIAYDCLATSDEYVAVVEIMGGVPPYTADMGTIDQVKKVFVSGPLPTGKVNVVEIKDSRLCKATLELEHDCQDALALAVQVGCTSANDVAPVALSPSGGDGKYEIRIGSSSDFKPISGPITQNLGAGSYTIQLRDGSGATTAINVVVPKQLKAVVREYTCEGTEQYFATILITGGVQPYMVNDKTVSDKYVTDLYKSGEVAELSILDANKCVANVTLQHSCADACGLPCNGLSMRCHYRLWIQPQDADKRFIQYDCSPVVVRVNGQDVKLGSAENAFRFTVDGLNSDFHNLMGGAVKVLNTAIEKSLKEMGNSQLQLTYEPLSDPYQTLQIEYFECETFNLEFEFVVATSFQSGKFHVRYTNEADPNGTQFNGVILTNLETGEQAYIPVALCQRRDLCQNTPYKAVCDAKIPKLAIAVEPLGNNRFALIAELTNLPASEIAAWIWDVPNGDRLVYTGQEVEAFIEKPDGLIRLTAITQKGCVGHADFPL
ncbi:MAG: hypothetical protein EP344_11345 [Bacteroidetes bacterium]|nr:MAG: hypothetical protein EP344_11345 [Bacteroidota bacterium]